MISLSAKRGIAEGQRKRKGEGRAAGDETGEQTLDGKREEDWNDTNNRGENNNAKETGSKESEERKAAGKKRGCASRLFLFKETGGRGKKAGSSRGKRRELSLRMIRLEKEKGSLLLR